jgi:small subunit ribosomal protein S18
MARNNDRDRSTRRAPRDTGRRTKKKICIFCKDHAEWVDYKDVNLLRKFMSDRGKIRARRVSGNCAQHQRDVATAIKTARELALLPYTQRTTSERPSGRGPGRGGPGGGRGPGAPRDAEAVETLRVEDVGEVDEDLDIADTFEADDDAADVADDGDGE